MSNMKSVTASIPRVTPETMKQMMIMSFELRKSLMIWGPPGVGKSASVLQVAEKLATEYADKGGFGVKDVRLSQYDPVDLRGVPKVESTADVIAAYKQVGNEQGLSDHSPELARWVEEFHQKGNEVRTRWAAPNFLPVEARDGKYGVLFLDELTSADPDVQAAAYQLVLDRRLGDYELPDGWVVIAAGNRPEDRAVVKDMSSALANRLIHVEVETDLREWINWAIRSDIHPTLVAYHRYTDGEKLYNFDPTTNDKAYPTPRAWETVSLVMSKGMNAKLLDYFVQGTVGIGHAVEFLAYASLRDLMPDIDHLIEEAQQGHDISKLLPATDKEIKRKIEYVARQDDGTMKEETSTQTFKGYCILYAVMAAVVSRANAKTGKAVWAIIKAVEKDHRDIALNFIGDVIVKDPTLTEGEFEEEFDAFCERNGDVTVYIPGYA